MTPNLAAFLTVISKCEGTASAPDPYRVCYGYPNEGAHSIVDLSYHPAEHRPGGSREWAGELLKPEYCRALGLGDICHSTAAGRYQLTIATWLRLKSLLQLKTFAGPSQDDCAVQLIKEHGALELVNMGRIAEALTTSVHQEWASLPGSTSGQPKRDLQFCLNAFSVAGGWYNA